MLKRALFASAALVIGATYMQGAVTPASAGQIKVKPKISVKPKPRIRVVRPKVRIKINPNRLARDTQEKKKKGTTPRLTQPRGTPAGYDTANKPTGDIPSPVSNEIDAPNTPTLDVSDGVRELFGVFGGKIPFEDPAGLPGVAAFPGYFPGWTPGNELPGGGSFSPQRIAVGNEGPFRAGGQYSDGRASSGGWVNGGNWDTGTTTGSDWTRRTSHGTDTYTVERSYSPETGFTVTTTITTAGPNGTLSTEETTTQPAGSDDGLRRYTRKTSTSDGIVSQEEGLTGTASAPNQEDGDGNGQPDTGGGGGGTAGGGTAGTTAPKPVADKKVGNKKIAVGDTKAGGGDQGGDYIDPTYSDRGGSIWTPLGGTVDRRVSPSDMTSQPPPSDVQGTVMVSGGRSGPTLGPEAVTNTGGGDFIAGEGRGGGGSMIAPCATVAGCGGDPDGGGIAPGPAGLEEPPASN